MQISAEIRYADQIEAGDALRRQTGPVLIFHWFSPKRSIEQCQQQMFHMLTKSSQIDKV